MTQETEETFTPAPLDEVIDGKTAPEAAPQGEEAAATPEPSETPENAPETPAEEPTAEQPQSEPQATAEEPQKPESWNYAAYKDEKSKRQALDQENQSLKARIAAMEWQQQQAQPPVEAPDVFADPTAYGQHLQQQTLSQVMPMVQGLQRQVAVAAHGEKVDAAEAWFNSLQPHEQQALNQKHGQSSDPYGGLVADYDAAQLAQEMSDPVKLEAFRAWQAQQAGQQPQTPAPQAPAPQAAPAAPRPSQVQLTPSVMAAPSVAPRRGTQWAGPKPLEDVLPE